MVEVAKDSDAGFEYPYLVYVPDTDLNDSCRLLVEPNNSGFSSDDLDEHRERAESRLEPDGRTRNLCDALGIPAIVPIFPRPSSEPVDWKHYTHALDRQTLEIDGGPLERIDLQLLSMVDHVREQIESTFEIEVLEEFLMNGFSATGNFVNRFSAIHPERVRASIAGGINGTALLPRSEVDGRVVEYHVGIDDLEDLTGKGFDLEAWRGVDQFVYLGGDDDNDTIPYGDAWSDELRQLALDVYGEHMQVERMPMCRGIYEEAGFTGWFRTYPNVGHRFISEEMESFLGRHTTSVSVRYDRPLAIGDSVVSVDVCSWPDEESYVIDVFDEDGESIAESPVVVDPDTISVKEVDLTRAVTADEEISIAAVDPDTASLSSAVDTDTTQPIGRVEFDEDPVAGDEELFVSYELTSGYDSDGPVAVRVETEEGDAQTLATISPGDSDTISVDLEEGLGIPFIQGRNVRVVIVDDDPRGLDPLASVTASVEPSDEPIGDIAEVDLPPAMEAGEEREMDVEVMGIGGPEDGEAFVQVFIDDDVVGETSVPVVPGSRETVSFPITAPEEPGEVEVIVGLTERTSVESVIVAERPSGSGTESDPYEVSTPAELAYGILSPTDHFALVDDIDLSGFSSFERIGTRSDPFTGSFDGRGYSISGLVLHDSLDQFEGLGLFGNVGGFARVHDLRVRDAFVDAGDSEFAGIIAGNSSDGVLFERVSSSGEVSGRRHVGGIVGGTSSGSDDVMVVGSSSDATVIAESNTSGGIVGQLSGQTIQQCYFSGELYDDGGRGGGIVGQEYFGGSVVECYASGVIDGGNGLIGGINDGGEVEDSYWDIEATGQSSSPGGGTGLTTDEMTGESASDSMTGLNFDDVWVTTSGYPELLWENPVLITKVDAPAEAVVGESVDFEVTVENASTEERDGSLDFTVAGDLFESVEYSLTPGEERIFEFTLDTDGLDIGSCPYAFHLAYEEVTRTIDLVSDSSPSFQVSGLDAPDVIPVEAEYEISVEVTNYGQPDEQPVKWEITDHGGVEYLSGSLGEPSLGQNESIEYVTTIGTDTLQTGQYVLTVETDDEEASTGFDVEKLSYVRFAEPPTEGSSEVRVDYRADDGLDEDSLRLRIGDKVGDELTAGPIVTYPGEEGTGVVLELERELIGGEEILAVLLPPGGYSPEDPIASESITVTSDEEDEDEDDDEGDTGGPSLPPPPSDDPDEEDESADDEAGDESEESDDESESDDETPGSDDDSSGDDSTDRDQDEDDGETEPGEPSDDGMSGFGVVSTIASLGGLGYVIKNRLETDQDS